MACLFITVSNISLYIDGVMTSKNGLFLGTGEYKLNKYGCVCIKIILNKDTLVLYVKNI